MAISVERRVVKGVNSWEIDKSILTRGLIIALLDLTLISFSSGRDQAHEGAKAVERTARHFQ